MAAAPTKRQSRGRFAVDKIGLSKFVLYLPLKTIMKESLIIRSAYPASTIPPASAATHDAAGLCCHSRCCQLCFLI